MPRLTWVMALAVIAATACGQPESEAVPAVQGAQSPAAVADPPAPVAGGGGTSGLPVYELAHDERDAEYLLAWELVATGCPDVGGFEVVRAFALRGENVDISPQESLEVAGDAPVGWVSQRFVRSDDPVSGQSMGVTVSFFDGTGTVREYLAGLAGPMGATVVETEGFTEASVETSVPLRVVQRFVAGNGIILHLLETAAGDAPLLCDPAALDGLLSAAKSNMALVEATPLP